MYLYNYPCVFYNTLSENMLSNVQFQCIGFIVVTCFMYAYIKHLIDVCRTRGPFVCIHKTCHNYETNTLKLSIT